LVGYIEKIVEDFDRRIIGGYVLIK